MERDKKRQDRSQNRPSQGSGEQGPEMGVLRIMVADEQPIVRWGVRQLVESHSHWRICGEAANADDALRLARQVAPDVLVMAMSMRGLGGVDLARQLSQEGNPSRVLLYSANDEASTIQEAIAAGARGIVLKSDSLEQVAKGIEALGAQRKYLSPNATRLMEERSDGDAIPGAAAFTARELEVAKLIVEGLSNREIGERLGRSIKTIETHRMAVMRKAGVHSTAGLVRFAIKHGIAEA